MPTLIPWRRGAAAVVVIVLALAAALAVFAAPKAAHAAQLTQITNFGSNPGNLQMYVYRPDNVAANPAIVVANHWCGGSAADFYNATQYRALAEQYGYIVVYPSVTRESKCFDVASQASLSGTGGDSVSIKSMVEYVIANYGADRNRVFATGVSSGAMMTNVLLGAHPEVFRAGSTYAGVPFTCFATTNGSEWNSECAQGQINRTPQQWGDAVRSANPGYAGPWPRMQVWFGTEDDVLRYPNFQEQIDQWTNVNGTDQTADYTDTPEPNWTRTRYGGTGGQAPVEAISMAGVDHGLPVREIETLRFFGLTGQGASAIVGTASNRCVDIPAGSTANGTQAVLWDCNGGANQSFTRTASGELRVGGKCLEAYGWGTANGTQAVIWDCTGNANQRWNVNANGTVTNVHNGLCLDATGGATANGTRLILWACSGTANQRWSLR
ncbi:extracellular catalytic domain type 1 short-chain-length polyhydroxyalkanoate depolymerase [Glycomyces terrestris]|uniref:PHB depolymerase family esterase n=1 Tax=Glycomyces terrestris TaxID=2493553 RepID=A0A426V3D9_9ACTN|nr:PHB depolymerase family esterase [Glycomyces terrestris]RRS01351.1 PHB depolymerase family esterase [Glycomyces terrestris]